MRILVTGSTGVIGSEIESQLTTSLHEVLLTARAPSHRIISALHHYHSIDLLDHADARKIAKEYKPEAIIHTAALASPDECERNKESAYSLNVEATRNLVEISNELKAHLVFMSTDFVFNGQQGPYLENDQREAVNYYGYTKIEAEDIVIKRAESWSIIRTVLSYGKQKDGARKSFPSMIIENLKKGLQLQLAFDQLRTPTYLPDLVDGLLQLSTEKIQGIFHLAGPDLISVFEFGQMIAERAGLNKELIIPVETQSLNHSAIRPLKTGLISNKARSVFGYKPLSIDEALERMNL